MKYALVEGERREAQPGLSGNCRVCGNAVIAKCGPLRVWHWAHRAAFTCDHWWEAETQWHRDWKNRFPKGWQEFIHQAANGEKHVADVKTKSGIVLEIQHSSLRRDERESRETFYQNMIWIVNGRRRKRDRSQFDAVLRTAICRDRTLPIFFNHSNESALLRDWVASRVPVYFDFGDEQGDTQRFGAPVLWRLDPRTSNGVAYPMVYLSPVLKARFLRAHLKGEPFEEIYSAAVERMTPPPRPQPLAGFERYMARRRRTRSRF